LDKRFIISEILKVVTAQYDHALEVVASSDQLIKSGDLKAESKWDTRAIEAGYLASAQKKRLKELEMELISLKNLEKNISSTDDISLGALITTDSKTYIITALTGGFKVKFKQNEVQVISLSAPIVKKLRDDEIEIINIE